MANTPEHHNPLPQPKETHDRGLAIIANPSAGEQVLLQRSPDGGMLIKFTGEIAIALPSSPSSEASDTEGDTEPKDEYGVVTRHITFYPAPEADLSPSEEEGNGQVPKDTPEALREPQSASFEEADAGSTQEAKRFIKDSITGEPIAVPKSENEKHEFVGNPVMDARYRVRKSGKRIADFVLATHPKKDQTRYYRIRAFDDMADRVRDTVKKGQKDVEVVAYGRKYWVGKKKTKEGWKDELTEGYYAGFVHAPNNKGSQKEEAQE